MKFPDEVPVSGTGQMTITVYTKVITTIETSLRNFIGKPLKINPFEVPEVLKLKRILLILHEKQSSSSITKFIHQ